MEIQIAQSKEYRHLTITSESLKKTNLLMPILCIAKVLKVQMLKVQWQSEFNKEVIEIGGSALKDAT